MYARDHTTANKRLRPLNHHSEVRLSTTTMSCLARHHRTAVHKFLCVTHPTIAHSLLRPPRAAQNAFLSFPTLWSSRRSRTYPLHVGSFPACAHGTTQRCVFCMCSYSRPPAASAYQLLFIGIVQFIRVFVNFSFSIGTVQAVQASVMLGFFFMSFMASQCYSVAHPKRRHLVEACASTRRSSPISLTTADDRHAGSFHQELKCVSHDLTWQQAPR